MDQFISFITQHWILSTAFAATGVALLSLEFLNTTQGARQLSPQQVTQLINHEDAVIIDIRLNERFKQGHILSAINIPSAEVETQLEKLTAHRNKPVIVICDTGQTSATIAAFLKKHDFTRAVSMKGGLNAWKEHQLPLVKGG